MMKKLEGKRVEGEEVEEGGGGRVITQAIMLFNGTFSS